MVGVNVQTLPLTSNRHLLSTGTSAPYPLVLACTSFVLHHKISRVVLFSREKKKEKKLSKECAVNLYRAITGNVYCIPQPSKVQRLPDDTV